jgi:hypothetical protein
VPDFSAERRQAPHQSGALDDDSRMPAVVDYIQCARRFAGPVRASCQQQRGDREERTPAHFSLSYRHRAGR